MSAEIEQIDQIDLDDFLQAARDAEERLMGAALEDLAYESMHQTILLARVGACLAQLSIDLRDIRDTLRIATAREHL